MQIMLANRQVNLLLGDGQIEGHAPLDQGHQLIHKTVVEGVNRDLGGVIDIAPGQRLHHIVNAAMGIDHTALGGLAGAMQQLGARHPDFDPYFDIAVIVTHPHRGIIVIADAAPKLNARLPFETIRQHPRHHIVERFGGVLRHPQRQLLIHPAINVRQGNIKIVNG